MLGLWARKTRTSLDDPLVDIVSPPLRFVFIPIGLRVFGTILQLPYDAGALLTHVIRSLLAVAMIWTAYRATDALSDMLEGLTARTETRLDDRLMWENGESNSILA